MEDKSIDILKKYGEREASDKLNSLGMTDNEGNTESPVKIGQRVWFVTYYDSKSLRDAWICSGVVLAVTITANGICVKLKDSYGHNKTYRLGKSAFLTKEEAEERLKDFLTQ